MLQKVKAFIEQYQMIEDGNHILVGVSGGADSVCLLWMLTELRKEYRRAEQICGHELSPEANWTGETKLLFEIEVVHVEHGIRGAESLSDADFTKRLCESLGIACTIVQVDVPAYAKEHGLGHEEAARILRYEAFVDLVKKRSSSHKKVKVALAHHMEDNAETMLFQMVRGSGLKGMCGISPVRTDADGMEYIRPLLCLQRGEIEDYLKVIGQMYCVDSTNLELEYSRNQLRHQVLPKLQEVNAQAVLHMNQSAGQLRLVWDYMQSQTFEVLECICITENPYTIDAVALCQAHPALQTMLAHEILARVAGRRKDITSIHVNDLLKLAQSGSGKQMHFPYGIRARKEYDRIVFSTAAVHGSEPVFQKHLSQLAKGKDLQEISKLLDEGVVSKERLSPTEELRVTDLKELRNHENKQIFLGEEDGYLVLSHRFFHGEMEKIPKNQYTKWLDYDKIKNGFQLRRRKSGDYFVNDSSGHHKKLKQYFIDEKIPATLRARLWLIVIDSEVVWIVGGRMSEAFKVTADTREILQIEFVEGSANGFYKRL